MVRSLLATVLAAFIVRAQAAPSTINARGLESLGLKFRHDGTFRLTVFSDLHLGEKSDTSAGPAQDDRTVLVMNNVLDSDPTDLVVLNGDLITGDATNLKNKTTLVEKLVEPMVKRGLFWASTYGNHDHSKTLAARNIMERERHYPGARTTSMVSGDDVGVSNYYLPVYASNCTTEKGDPGRLSSSCPPSLILWFFDSRGGEYYDRTGSDGKPVQQPNWVHPDVAHWFRRTSVRLRRANGGQVIPSIAFVHIPTNASNLIQPKVKPDRNPGVNDEAPGLQQSASGM